MYKKKCKKNCKNATEVLKLPEIQVAKKLKYLSILAGQTKTPVACLSVHYQPVFVVTIAHGCNLSMNETERERERGCSGYSVGGLRTKLIFLYNAYGINYVRGEKYAFSRLPSRPLRLVIAIALMGQLGRSMQIRERD